MRCLRCMHMPCCSKDSAVKGRGLHMNVSSARSESWLSGLFCGHCVQGACSWSSLVFGLTATSDSETATP